MFQCRMFNLFYFIIFRRIIEIPSILIQVRTHDCAWYCTFCHAPMSCLFGPVAEDCEGGSLSAAQTTDNPLALLTLAVKEKGHAYWCI